MTRPVDTRRRQQLPNARRGVDGKPLGSRCTGACLAPANSQCHCSVCHQTIRTVSDFDRHRIGGECLELTELGLVEVDGLWASPEGHAQRETLRRRFEQDPPFPVIPRNAGGLEGAVSPTDTPRTESPWFATATGGAA